MCAMRLIKTTRGLLGVSVTELAKEAGISRRELTRIESRVVTASDKSLSAIDRAFDRILERRVSAARSDA